MNKGRRIGTAVAAAVAAAGMATVGLGAPANAAPQPQQGPRPVFNVLPAVRANTTTWVNVAWRTDRPVCHAQVRYNGGPRIRIGYWPPRGYATFTRGDYLLPFRPDVTRIQVTPYFFRPGVALIGATIQYDDCRPFARRQFATTVLTLPVIRGGIILPGGPHGPGGLGNGQGGPGGHGWPGNGPGGHGWPGNGPGGHGWPGNGPDAQGGPSNVPVNHQGNGPGGIR